MTDIVIGLTFVLVTFVLLIWGLLYKMRPVSQQKANLSNSGDASFLASTAIDSSSDCSDGGSGGDC